MRSFISINSVSCALSALPALLAILGLVGCGSAAARGKVHVGDTPEKVRSALGRPDATGWVNVIVPGRSDQTNQVVHAPVTREIYRTQAKADLVVLFTDGAVSSVESQ